MVELSCVGSPRSEIEKGTDTDDQPSGDGEHEISVGGVVDNEEAERDGTRRQGTIHETGQTIAHAEILMV
jgi:hypothetical protein